MGQYRCQLPILYLGLSTIFYISPKQITANSSINFIFGGGRVPIYYLKNLNPKKDM